MSYHILHLLSPNLRVRLKLEQLHIQDVEKGTEKSVPLADIAVIVSAVSDLTVTASALRRMAELNVLLLVCNESFEPCALNVPYYCATDTELLRRQIAWSSAWKTKMWRQIVAAKVRNQAANLEPHPRIQTALREIAQRCAEGPGEAEEVAWPEVPMVSLASITMGRRHGLHRNTPNAAESRAARHYWKHFIPPLAEALKTKEKHRLPGTRQGLNGMLDYGYAILRTAVLRSLAVHGFIAAIGIAHTPRAGTFALADDVMEPLRPWMDRALRAFVGKGGRTMEDWMRACVEVLTAEVLVGKSHVRMLHAIDLYVRSFATSALATEPRALTIPMLP